MIAKDKLLHIGMGIGAVGVTVLAVLLAQWKLGAALALMTTVFYEFQQWWRKDGVVDVWDAVATAAPGWVAWLILEAGK